MKRRQQRSTNWCPRLLFVDFFFFVDLFFSSSCAIFPPNKNSLPYHSISFLPAKKPVLLYPRLKLAHSTRFSLVDYYVQQLSHQTLLSVRRNTINYYKLFSETSKIKQNQTNRSKLFLVDSFLIGHFRIELPLVGG